jgi:hypothetical protein
VSAPEAIEQAEREEGPSPVPVAPPDPSEPAILTLELRVPEPEPERVITVSVIDSFGDPIPAALVVFREGAELLYRERTALDGKATFAPYDEERGPFRLDVLALGYLPGTIAEVHPGGEPEIILAARPVLEGEVRAPSRGQGFVRLFVGERELRTDLRNDGTFLFEDLDEGYATVQAEVPAYGAASLSVYLEPDTHRFVRLRVRPDSRVRIEGRIRFWVPGGRALINGVPVPVTHSGAYEFERAVIGVNEIFVDAPGKALMRERFSVAGRNRNHHDFKLSTESRIKGRVRSAATGRAITGARVRLGISYGDPRNDRVPLFPLDEVAVVTTDADGRFEIRRLDRRLIYLVSVVAPGFGQSLVQAVPGGGFLRVKLPEGPFLFGRLRGIGGVPRDAIVSATRLEEAPKGLIFNVPNYDGTRSGRDREGLYGLSGLLPGAYLVRVEAADYGTVETVVDLRDGRRARLDLRVRRGAQLEQQDAELLRRLPPALETETEDLPPGQTTILRVDARRPESERPFGGLRVVFFEGDREVAPPMDFTEPEIELVGLAEGYYRAILTHSVLPKPIVRDGIHLKRGEPVNVRLR